MLLKFLSPIRYYLLLLCLLSPITALAGVSMMGTRVIYTDNMKAHPVTLRNQSNTPYVIQMWVDETEQSSAEPTNKVPFIVVPHLFRIAADSEQTARIIFTGAPLPQDRETLYWFNFHQIPPTGQSDSSVGLQFSVLNKVKLFYRPKTIKGSALDAPKQLEFSLLNEGKKGWFLQAKNPTGFYINFSGNALKLGEMSVSFDQNTTLAPFSALRWKLPSAPRNPKSEPIVTFSFINDEGGSLEINNKK